ncbi:MAG: TAXI family TRAP transporter solute-binding subunit, partial [Bythopirellula sp.]
MALRPDSLLSQQFQETRRQLRGLWLKIWGGGFLVVLAGFAVAWFFIQPAPPRNIVIATGPEDGAYYRFAQEYQNFLLQHGVSLTLRPTAGSIENYRLLETDPSVHLAIVQGGTAPADLKQAAELESLASLYLEPVWVFYRGNERVSELRQLRNAKIAIGRDSSGTESVALTLLEENGIDPSDSAQLIHAGGERAVRLLQNGEVDAAIFVSPPHLHTISELMQSDEIRLLSFERHKAYVRRHPYLTSVTLEQGVMDLERDLPAADVLLVAPAANLIANTELHDSLVPLLLRAATETHEGGSSIVSPGRFPSKEFVEFPLNESARLYFEFGPPFLQKYLPFWIASAIDRGKILLIPALTLLLPLFRVAPPLYRWRIHSRIYRWYLILREIEGDLREHADGKTLRERSETLSTMEQELDDLDSVPLSYMEEFYNLRLHVEFVERRVSRALD